MAELTRKEIKDSSKKALKLSKPVMEKIRVIDPMFYKALQNLNQEWHEQQPTKEMLKELERLMDKRRRRNG